jgi:hypothetical protein
MSVLDCSIHLLPILQVLLDLLRAAVQALYSPIAILRKLLEDASAI